MSTNAGMNTAAAASPPSTTGEPQPEMPPLEMPSTSPVRPTRNVSVPSASNLVSVSRPVSSLRISQAQALPARASGTLNQNTQPQPKVTSAPPSTGPMTRP